MEMIDIVVTTYNRLRFLKQTMESLLQSTKNVPRRISVADDCSTDGTREYLSGMAGPLNRVVLSDKRRGVVPNFNDLWDATVSDKRYPHLCYLQDDMVAVEPGWLAILLDAHRKLKDIYNIGFSSAYDAPEHPAELEIDWNGRKAKIKKSSSGQNLLAEKEFWLSIGKPPPLNPDGSARGFPGNGRGSQIDVWFMGCYSLGRFDPRAAAPNCLHNQGKRVLVVPMLRHLGIDKRDSTWRQNRAKGF